MLPLPLRAWAAKRTKVGGGGAPQGFGATPAPTPPLRAWAAKRTKVGAEVATKCARSAHPSKTNATQKGFAPDANKTHPPAVNAPTAVQRRPKGPPQSKSKISPERSAAESCHDCCR